jgi:hypothetical protein
MSPALMLDGSVLGSMRQALFRVLVNLFSAVLFGMVFLFVLTLLRMLVRKSWIAIVLWCVILSAPQPVEDPVAGWIGGLVRSVLMLVVLMRGGLLALVTALYVGFALLEAPVTTNVTAWYAVYCVPALLVVALLTAYGFQTSLAGKPVLGRGLLDD